MFERDEPGAATRPGEHEPEHDLCSRLRERGAAQSGLPYCWRAGQPIVHQQQSFGGSVWTLGLVERQQRSGVARSVAAGLRGARTAGDDTADSGTDDTSPDTNRDDSANSDPIPNHDGNPSATTDLPDVHLPLGEDHADS